MGDLYWAVVTGDVTEAGRSHEPALNDWWSHEHVPLYVARPGFHRAWRLQTVEHGAQIGSTPQKYFAVYEIDDIDVFSLALAEEQWGPFDKYVGDWLVGWQRTYHRRLVEYGAPESRPGTYWAIVKADPLFFDSERETEFRKWYEEKHVPEICAEPGIHGAWRLAAAPHEGQLGEHAHRYWAVYSIDTPDAFGAVLERRKQRGIPPWEGIWTPELRDWGISFHKILHHELHEPARMEESV